MDIPDFPIDMRPSLILLQPRRIRRNRSRLCETGFENIPPSLPVNRAHLHHGFSTKGLRVSERTPCIPM